VVVVVTNSTMRDDKYLLDPNIIDLGRALDVVKVCKHVDNFRVLNVLNR
jgi:hypothetical protein